RRTASASSAPSAASPAEIIENGIRLVGALKTTPAGRIRRPSAAAARGPSRASSSISCALHWHYVALASFDHGEDVLTPTHQCRLYGAFIGRSVVNPGNAGPMSAVMIERGLDHVRLDSDVGHLGGDAAPEVVNAPWLYLAGKAMVEVSFAARPICEPSIGAVAKQVISGGLRHRLDDLERRRRQGDRVCAVIFAALGRQCPRGGVEVEFRPTHSADLGASIGKQDQQSDDAPVI